MAVMKKTLMTTALSLSIGTLATAATHNKPNVIVILADDLGYGDLSCYGATKLKTPNIDKIAGEGLRFTNAYAPSSVCSPTRYSLLTGRNWWRNPLNPPKGVVAAAGPLVLNEPGILTMPEMFRQKGYQTAAVGKWHLGFGVGESYMDRFDWNKRELKPGPLDCGFDTFFGMAGNVLNEPQFYIKDRDFVGRKPGDKITITKNGKFAKPWDPKVLFKDNQFATDINNWSVDYIRSLDKNRPFFLYYASNIPHKPITPHPSMVGSSECGIYGDMIQELDVHVGNLIDVLKETGQYENTLIVITSDNGAVVAKDEKFAKRWHLEPMFESFAAGHSSCGVLRDGKHAVYEGGNRIPCIVRWPGQVPAGKETDSLFALTDVMASFATILNVELTGDSGKDSIDRMALWRGKEKKPARDYAISRTHTQIFSIRSGEWKLIEGDPANDTKRAKENQNMLFNVDKDPGETKNVWNDYPETAERLLKLLKANR